MKLRNLSVPAALACVAVLPACAQQQPPQGAAGGLAVQIAPHAYVVTEQGENLVLIADSAGTMVAGVQVPALVAKARRALTSLHAGPVRYALLMDGPNAARYVDGGWGADGAVAIAHEELRGRIRRTMRDPSTPPPAGARMPAMGYSEVVQVLLGGEEAHLVKQPSGYSGADAAIHFEGAGVLYLNAFTMDGYPEIDVEAGGTLAGMIETDSAFVTNFAEAPQAVEPIVPARGPLATLAQLGEFRDMLKAVHDGVASLVTRGMTVEQAVAARPTASFDARWGRGAVTPERFVRAAYASILKEREAAAASYQQGHSH